MNLPVLPSPGPPQRAEELTPHQLIRLEVDRVRARLERPALATGEEPAQSEVYAALIILAADARRRAARRPPGPPGQHSASSDAAG